MSVLLNMFLAIDLMLMIRHPFKLKEKRVRWYVFVSLAMTVPTCIAYQKSLDFNKKKSYCVPNEGVFTFMACLMGAYLLASFASIIYATKKMCKPWVSKESQRIVLGRHILSLFGSMLAYAYLNFSYIYTV